MKNHTHLAATLLLLVVIASGAGMHLFEHPPEALAVSCDEAKELVAFRTGVIALFGRGQASPLSYGRRGGACGTALPSPMTNGIGKRGKPRQAAGVVGEGKRGESSESVGLPSEFRLLTYGAVRMCCPWARTKGNLSGSTVVRSRNESPAGFRICFAFLKGSEI